MVRHDRLIGTSAVCLIFNCSRSTLWRRIRAGEFPKPVDGRPGRPSEWWESTIADEQRKRGGRPVTQDTESAQTEAHAAA